MAQTVIGLFENDNEAQKAVERLEQIGISRSNVDMTRGGSESGVTNERDSENGITRFFKNLFGDSEDADRYSKVSGNTSIVTVHAQSADEAERAADILDEAGAIDVDERASEYSGREAYVASDSTTSNDEKETTIPRIQEELQVGKREVENGAVRLRSRIVEKPVEESIRLREEHVSVDRQQVNRPLTDADRAAFQDQDIELTERAEVPVINKEARVVEEVRLSKDVTERSETIRDTVRNTEVDVERTDSEDRNSDRYGRSL